MNDLTFVKAELDKVLEEASKYAQKDNETKKEFVLRVKEKTIIVFVQENKPMATLASYVWGRLDIIEFHISKGYFEACFNDDEKRNYSHMFSSEHFTATDNPDILKNPITGQIKVDEIVYSPDIPTEAKPKPLESEQEPKYNKDKYTDLLNLIGVTGSKLQTTCDAILERYEDNRDIVQSCFKPLEFNQRRFSNLYAIIANSKDVLDDRNKWGDYEKIMAKFLMDGGETIAHISKLMDYSSKFGSIGILNNADIANKVLSLGACPACKVDIHYEINERLKQLEIEAEFTI